MSVSWKSSERHARELKPSLRKKRRRRKRKRRRRKRKAQIPTLVA